MNVETARAIVRVEYLLATEPFISNEETRYYLNGIFIDPHPRSGAKLVATDGHTLSCIYDWEAIVSGEPTIWSKPFKSRLDAPFKAFRKAMGKGVVGNIYADLTRAPNTSRVRLVCADTAAEVFNGGGIEFFTKSSTAVEGHFWIDGTFPVYERVIPRDCVAQGGQAAWFNAKYMAKISTFSDALEAAAAASSGPAPMAMFANPIGDGPAIVRVGQPNAFVVIMPMRHTKLDAEERGVPDWYLDPGEPKPAFEGKRDLKIAA